jgi:protein phosphatase
MIVQICSQTDPGLERSQNEDAVAYDDALGLCILCDGMGGHNAGEVASGMAAAFIKSDMRASPAVSGRRRESGAVQQAIAQSIEKANSAIYNLSRTNSQYAGMGTTLVVGVFCDDVLVLGHIGDSRCYLLRAGKLTQLTKDHSVYQEQLDDGLLDANHVMPVLGQNFVTRALGPFEAVAADFQQPALALGDIYLMCSDGLTDMVDDDAIATILGGPERLQQKADGLIAAANQGGGRDNVSVVLAQVEEEPKAGLLGTAARALFGVLPGAKGR